jgi:folate-binding protein YgfZ
MYGRGYTYFMPDVFNASAASGLAGGSVSPVLGWSWVTLSGRDGRDFLHRLTTVNVNALEIGQGAPGFFLNAQGKMRAYFTLWRFGDQDYAFELDAGATGHWKKELLAAIDQYTFAEKFALADVTASLEARWIFADAGSSDGAASLLAALGTPGLEPGRTTAIDEEIRICHHGDRDFGRAWVTAWGRPARLAQWIERQLPQARAASWETLESWRVASLRPRVDAELDAATIPLEAGLTDALAQGKGCYPGQEVIERIVSLGSPARRLVQIQGEGEAPKRGEALHNLAEPPLEVGLVTSVAPRSGGTGFMALAFVRKLHAKEGLEVRFAGAGSLGSITRVAPYA